MRSFETFAGALCAVAVMAVSIVAVAGYPATGTAADGAPTTVIELPDGFAWQTVAEGITGATSMAIAPDGRVFVCEQTGALRVVKNGELLPQPFAEFEVDSAWERGLLGVALHPEFEQNGYVYVCYVAARPYPHHRISRLTARGDVADRHGEKILFRGDDQTRLGGSVPAGHQGGGIHFGGDGKLYVAIGEQTAGAPSQRLDSLLGKMLRLNPDGSIPKENPFFRQAHGKYRAIWALGLRNPFGFAVQPNTGRIFINDVGGSRWEEINAGEAGANYGWPESEGYTEHPGHRTPILAYGESPQQSITGGAFCNPPKLQFPEQYQGRYFFADYMFKWVRTLDPDHPRESVEPFAAGLAGPVDLQFAPDGSLYCLTRNVWVKDDKFQPHTGSLLRIFYVPHSDRAAPRIVGQPQDIVALRGQPLNLNVAGEGEQPLRFRWQQNGQWISGAETATLSLDPGPQAVDGAQYRCVIANRHGATCSRPATVWYARLNPASQTTSRLASGLAYDYHEGEWSRLPRFSETTKVGSGDIAGIDIGPRRRDRYFGFSFRGFIQIDQDGLYEFAVRSSGAAKMFVAGEEIASLGMNAGRRDCHASVGLQAGRHPLRLDCAFGAGTPEIAVTIRSAVDGSAPRPLPPAMLFHAEQPQDEPAGARPLVTTTNVPRQPADLPRLLSQTGIFHSLETLEPELGILPYSVNAPLWSDGALKRRWIALPGEARIAFSDQGSWHFPAGTVFIKHFELGPAGSAPHERHKLETRLLVVDRTGKGYGVTYKWRPDGSDAELLEAALTEEVAAGRGIAPVRWSYPGRADCLVCHTARAGFVLGVNTRQLNGLPARDCVEAGRKESANVNQLLLWTRRRMFERDLADTAPAQLPRLAALTDESAPLEYRVRSYLDANCAQCHRPGGVRAEFDARFEVPLSQQKLLTAQLLNADLGIAGPAVVVPGNRERSMLYQRMKRRHDVFNMPPLATNRVDEEALELVGRWIDGLAKPQGQ